MSVLLAPALLLIPALPQAGDVVFGRQQLSDEFFCEGAAFGDLNGDGQGDVVAGPYWYAGPDFAERREIYPPAPIDPLEYSDNFFAWTHDLNGDGRLDVLVVGFPGRDAFWFENPGPGGLGEHWPRHTAFTGVNNEAPLFDDLTGDGQPELVFHTGGRFGYAQPAPDDPRAPWRFRPVSGQRSLGPFIHGLGVGDVNGDGRPDLLERGGWFEHPAPPAALDGPWRFHAVDFALGRRGGAQMFAGDVDGDGDADVLTSLDGHGFGLAWFEQTAPGEFEAHLVLDGEPKENTRGVVVSQLHALAYIDVDGDGLRDVVTGKRWWAHGPSGDPGSDAPADLLWFRLVRGAGGEVELVPEAIDHDSGVGTQVAVGDVDGDGRPDVVVGNKKGTFVFLQSEGGVLPRGADGAALNLDLESGDLSDWTATGEAFAGQPVRGDTVTARDRERCRLAGDYWIGGYELAGDGATGTLVSAPFVASTPYASFLVGGGGHAGTRVELALAGAEEAFFRTSGANSESMQRVVADLRGHRGELLEIRLIDEELGGWGHVNFDDLRLHASRPSFALDPRVPRILPRDRELRSGLTPDEAVAAMTLPPGFEVDVIAAEPELHQPVTFTIDPKGRIWVVEAHSYPNKRAAGEGLDAILVFEDRDHDGSFETRTVFQDGLNLVSGLEVGFGGVWVGQAPELLFVPDANDDLVPDGPPEVLLDGWGLEDTHETLNSFVWGPDGWLYGCHGVFTHSRVGPPGAADDEREEINAGVWRYHPTRREFEVFAWGTSNPWGLDFDDRGQAFVTACVIPHLFHTVQGGRYHRQAGSHFNRFVYDDIKTIADHRHYLGDSPHAGNGRSGAAGGGHAHCGAMIYQGDAFPAEYRGRIFMANIHGNRLNTDALEREGSGFVGRHGEDFLLANDAWFRGVHLRYGPDGAVYVADWYDQQACHLTDPVRWDRSNGRLYRVSFGRPATVEVDLAALSDIELARLQLHGNEWYVRRARVLLQERGAGEEARRILRTILRNHEDEGRRLRALWALHAAGALGEDDLLYATRDRFEYVRGWAVQLLLEGGVDAPWRARVLAELAAGDPSPATRLFLASGLQRLPLAERWSVAAGLIARSEDADDANLPLLIWYGVEPLVAADPERALAALQASAFPRLARFAARRAAADAAGLGAVLTAAAMYNALVRRNLVDGLRTVVPDLAASR
ncbi:MAG: PVC-type heme-binding CxxCH protein, partial [Planctomycetota bacterium]